MKSFSVVCAALAAVASATNLQAWSTALNSSGGQDTPVTRVVNLLKEMSKTLETDMEEDENLFKELECWCNTGKYEKEEAIKVSTAKIAELGSLIEGSAARTAELTAAIKELGATLASDKQALAEASALREKQVSEFHGMEMDSMQALENLKAAVTVLAKHQDAPPDSTVAGGAVFESEKDSWSLLELNAKKSKKSFPWADSHEGASSRALDNFMRQTGFDDDAANDEVVSRKPIAPHKFLQQSTADAAKTSTWTSEESAIVKRAMTSAIAFVQSKHEEAYFPAYTSQSGEIFGVLKQLEEEMQGDLKEAQAIEQERAAAFAELRAAKSEEIKNNEAMEEQKEDELANMDSTLAEAKEDLDKEQKVLEEDQTFFKNLNDLCAKGSSDFDERKAARLEEMKAVTETIEILQGDEARDAMSGTFNFVQISAGRQSSRRQRVAALLRRAGLRTGSLDLSVLASSVELDAFTKVKEAMDEMLKMMQTQQADEVKKNDWCKDEIQQNEMTTAKTTDRHADLTAKIAELEQTIKTLGEEIDAGNPQITQNELNLQTATEDRQKENHEFQKTIADQTMTVEVLKKALDRLATFYDFLQKHQQTPPVPQKEYKPSVGAGGVMEMIEKLIHDSQDLMADSKKSESNAQAGYEQLVADTNGSVEALQKEIVAKSAAKSGALKDELSAESSLVDTNKELEGLGKYNADLHKECDYLLKNFDLRQKGRGEEMEAIQQAKQILSGASFD